MQQLFLVRSRGQNHANTAFGKRPFGEGTQVHGDDHAFYPRPGRANVELILVGNSHWAAISIPLRAAIPAQNQ